MARYLLDTDVLIDISKRIEPARSSVADLIRANEEVGLCPIQLTEFYAGRPRGARLDWDEFIDALPCWPITPSVGIAAGDYRRAFARIGRSIGTPDAINAAVAQSVGATIVTRNVWHYPMADVETLVP